MAKPGEHNFQAVCINCGFYKKKTTFHRCTVAVDVITGSGYETDCYGARSKLGHCGPKGVHFVSKITVTGS